MKFIRIILFIAGIFLGNCNTSSNQGNDIDHQEQRISGPPPFARVKSPEFNPDSTITFRIWAPRATEVELECAALIGDQPDEMERFDEEYWRITVKPVTSGLFQSKRRATRDHTPAFLP